MRGRLPLITRARTSISSASMWIYRATGPGLVRVMRKTGKYFCLQSGPAVAGEFMRQSAQGG